MAAMFGAWLCRKVSHLCIRKISDDGPSVLNAIAIIRAPKPLYDGIVPVSAGIGAGKSRSQGGRPQVGADLPELIRQMSVDNPLLARDGSVANCSSSALR